jgi:septal ring factor EnvC (AmiA/AmiB activator)
MALPVRRIFGVLAVVTALVVTPLTGAAAGPVRTADYPSWDDVKAAQQNQATAQAEVDRITSLLDQLEASAAQLSNEKLKRGEEYLLATYKRDTAQATAADLQARATEASKTAETAKRQAGMIAAQLYKSGGDNGTVQLMLGGKKSDALLYRLGTMSQLTAQTAGLRDAAEISANTAASLQEQATAALAERDRLADEADAALQAVEDAQAAVEAQLAEEQQHSETLYNQLATLKNTTAATEQSYREGEAKKAEEAARAAAAAAAAAAESGTGSSWVPDSGSVASPADAKAYAASVMPYYGWGGDEYSCLVQLWNGESGWRVNAYNPSSGAYGIPQSLPANKMASVAGDWATNAATQITWGLNYISDRYGSPCNAWASWNNRSPHWY